MGAPPIPSRFIQPDLVYLEGKLVPEIAVEICADGRFGNIGPVEHGRVERRARCAMFPGFVSAHSHAFQRGLRGHGETFPCGQGSFWSWRQAMYQLVERLDAHALHEICLSCFGEMLAAGITTVGEFHYLRHDESGAGFAMDDVVLGAAQEAGIRMALIVSYYRTGGFDGGAYQTLSGGQRRFAVRSEREYWDQVDALAARLDPDTQSIVASVHSLRAAPIAEIASIRAEARRRGLAMHLHVEEQTKEIADCMALYGRTPMRVLLDAGVIDQGVTGVHCTHTSEEDLRAFHAAGATVCYCPLTEANLGDGFAPIRRSLDARGAFAIGTDSNARLSMLEEMRWLEYAARLRSQSRGVCSNERGQVAPVLLHAATRGGATALGLNAGEIRTGAAADFILIDLGSDSLRFVDCESLPDALVFGADDSCIAESWVRGEGRSARFTGRPLGVDQASSRR